MIWKITKCTAEINQDVNIKMFDNLKNRIHLANEDGLVSYCNQKQLYVTKKSYEKNNFSILKH